METSFLTAWTLLAMLLWSGLSQMTLSLPQDSDYGLNPVFKVSSWSYVNIYIIEHLHWIDIMLGTDVIAIGQNTPQKTKLKYLTPVFLDLTA